MTQNSQKTTQKVMFLIILDNLQVTTVIKTDKNTGLKLYQGRAAIFSQQNAKNRKDTI